MLVVFPYGPMMGGVMMQPTMLNAIGMVEIVVLPMEQIGTNIVLIYVYALTPILVVQQLHFPQQ